VSSISSVTVPRSRRGRRPPRLPGCPVPSRLELRLDVLPRDVLVAGALDGREDLGDQVVASVQQFGLLAFCLGLVLEVVDGLLLLTDDVFVLVDLRFEVGPVAPAAPFSAASLSKL